MPQSQTNPQHLGEETQNMEAEEHKVKQPALSLPQRDDCTPGMGESFQDYSSIQDF